MTNILIDMPDNEQVLIQVGEGGGYNGPGSVIWNELVDGDIGDITLGAMIRVDSSLVFSQDRKDLHDAAVLAASVPKIVTMRQAELALKEAGYFDDVVAWVATLDGELESYWRRSATVKRQHAFVEAARIELNLTHAQMDALFVLAASKEE